MAEVRTVGRTVRTEWLIEGSTESKSIVNPIRDIVDGRKLEQNPHKNLISLSIGEFIPNKLVHMVVSWYC